MPTTDFDIALFETVSDLLQQQREAAATERRTQARRPYECVQLLAPYDGDRLPSQADFRQVQCKDLSERGFAFLTIRRPETQWVIIALGAVPFLFFIAEIMHVRPADDDPDFQFQIGCRFVRRVSADTPPK